MSCDISKLRRMLLSQDNPDLKKSSDLSLALIGMINDLFDGDFESDEIKLTEDDFFSVVSCGLFMLESCVTIKLNGGHINYSFSESKHIHPESVIPRCLFLMCYGRAFYENERDAKAFFIDSNKGYDELSNSILNIYMSHRNWDFLYDYLGISHLFKTKAMTSEFERKIYLINSFD